MQILTFANNAATSLTTGISSIATSVTVDNGGVFPTLGSDEAFKMTFVDAATGLVNEIVLVTARTGNVLTIVRGQEDTTARAWLAGDVAAGYNTAGTQADFVQSNQLQAGIYTVAEVGGSANVITGTLPSDLSELPDMMAVRFPATAINSGAVTFQLELGDTDTGQLAVVKYGNQALIAGDIPVIGYPVTLVYSAILNKWVLANPAGVPSATAFGLALISAANAAAGRVVMGTVIGTDVQAQSANLSALAALTIVANSLTVGTGAGTVSQVTLAANKFLARASTGNLEAKDVSDFGLSLSAAADASAVRTLLSLVVGTNVQAYSANLTSFAGVSPSANGLSLVSAADYAAMRVLLGLVIGTNVQAYNANYALLNVQQSWTKAQAVTPVALTDAATVAIDGTASNTFRLLLTTGVGASRVIGNPTGMADGQVINIRITQSSAGGNAATWGSMWKFPGGAPTLSTGANEVDQLSGIYYSDTGFIDASLSKAFA